MKNVATFLIWMLAVFYGITVGAGLYEARIVLPLWRNAARTGDWIETGRRFWVFVSTVPLTLTILAGLIVSFRWHGPGVRWWQAALAIGFVERAMTFGYFIPQMARMQAGDAPSQGLELWANLNLLRHALSISAWLLALRALQLTGAARTATG